MSENDFDERPPTGPRDLATAWLICAVLVLGLALF